MKVLVANRSEIAIRILRACRELGFSSVAVYTDTDQSALHIRYADEAVSIGAKQNYLSISAILEAAHRTGVDAIHPGYGFLSENAEFAKAVEDAGMIFIGPRSETIALLGDKLASRKAALDADLPVLPGSNGALGEEISPEILEQVTFPLLVKAAAGGGGRGIRLAESAKELPEIVAAARKEALSAFGDDTVFLEGLVQDARHIEVQIIGDGNGKIVCLGERECSIQRRRQKLIEEAPAPGLSAEQRAHLYKLAEQLCSMLKYRSLGTVEFLLSADGQFHFIEVNPRIQVEHPVTEMVTGIDLVKEQLMLASGEPLELSQEDIELRGSAIEARVLAEDTENGFLPSIGQVTYLKEPGGVGIRVESALYQGINVGADYDSLLAKVISWGEDRSTAIQRLRRGLSEYQISGVATDLDFLQQIIKSKPFQKGQVTTTYLDHFTPSPRKHEVHWERAMALAAALYAHRKRLKTSTLNFLSQSRWQQIAWREQMRGI